MADGEAEGKGSMIDRSPAPPTTDASVEAIRTLYQVAHERNMEVSALSWNGFNLMGDRKSINEVKRLIFSESRMKGLEERLNAKS